MIFDAYFNISLAFAGSGEIRNETPIEYWIERRRQNAFMQRRSSNWRETKIKIRININITHKICVKSLELVKAWSSEWNSTRSMTGLSTTFGMTMSVSMLSHWIVNLRLANKPFNLCDRHSSPSVPLCFMSFMFFKNAAMWEQMNV